MDLNSFVDPLKTVNPHKVVLFGSYANGAPSVDSDIDLLVILPTTDPYYLRIQRLRQLLPKDRAVDLIVLTPEEYRQASETNLLLKEIAATGKVLYGQ